MIFFTILLLSKQTIESYYLRFYIRIKLNVIKRAFNKDRTIVEKLETERSHYRRPRKLSSVNPSIDDLASRRCTYNYSLFQITYTAVSIPHLHYTDIHAHYDSIYVEMYRRYFS